MKKLVLIALVIMMSSSAGATQLAGVEMPDTFPAGIKQLALNGAGIRTKYFMKLYVGGLYLMQKEQNPQKIIAADEPMAIKLHIISGLITSDKMIAVINEGFVNATKGNTTPLTAQIDSFIAFFREKIEENDIFDILYIPEQGVVVHKNNKKLGIVAGLEFKQALFGIWLCDKPADKALKKGMLGG
ncbi:chalcone isomerase family protein [candidate division CSSED10-310 bacterium]|uniref:Chalcone isomerase family protein n=1 Tax=candidate division CSSED10-310 bacterium TaxID=2855610 RepID=A0ABV6YYZ2_UNCC1